MASNEQMWTVADGILDAKEYTKENLSSVENVKAYADAIEIRLTDTEAMAIIGFANSYLGNLVSNPGHSSNYYDLKQFIENWDRGYLLVGKYELVDENKPALERLMEGRPIEDYQIEKILADDRMYCGNVDGETVAEYMNLKNGCRFSLRQENPDDLTIYVKQIG